MVIALDLSPGQVIVQCSWATHFTLTVPLSTQEYKWVPGNCQGNLMKCWEVTCNGLAFHPGGVTILLARGGGGGHSLIWPIRGHAAGQGMVFGLFCPEQVIQFYANLS